MTRQPPVSGRVRHEASRPSRPTLLPRCPSESREATVPESTRTWWPWHGAGRVLRRWRSSRGPSAPPCACTCRGRAQCASGEGPSRTVHLSRAARRSSRQSEPSGCGAMQARTMGWGGWGARGSGQLRGLGASCQRDTASISWTLDKPPSAAASTIMVATSWSCAGTGERVGCGLASSPTA